MITITLPEHLAVIIIIWFCVNIAYSIVTLIYDVTKERNHRLLARYARRWERVRDVRGEEE